MNFTFYYYTIIFYSFITKKNSEQETSRKAVLGWLSRAFPSDAEGGVTAASGDAAKDDSGDRIVLNEGYDST